jgi:cysteine-rich repeat protein
MEDRRPVEVGVPAVCGNGVLESGEACDDSGESATCNLDCTVATCGDGQLNLTAGEQCEIDSDCAGGEVCGSDCGCDVVPVCGDGVLQQGGGPDASIGWEPVPMAGNVGVSARILPVDIDGDGDTDFTADGNAEDHIYLWTNVTGGGAVGFDLTIVDGSYPGNARPGWSASGDINADGLIDIVAGGGEAVHWYEAPAWIRHPLEIDSTAGGNGGIVTDVDGDGRLDVIAALFNTDLVWWRNPGPAAVTGVWPRFTIHAGGAAANFNHDLALGDIDGDLQDELVALYVGGGVFWYDVPADPAGGSWPSTRILDGTVDPYVGLSLGDLDGDTDLDVIVSNRWYERPLDPTSPDWLGREVFPSAVQNLQTVDVNGDGRLDVVGAEGFVHPDGRVLWAESPSDPRTRPWTVHVIADSLDGPENLWAGDLDGNGTMDVLTGEMGTSTGWNDNDSNLLLLENHPSGGEECDDGGTSPGDGCDQSCILEQCGNGVMQSGEECDDGNLESGDGCDDLCLVEPAPTGVDFADDFDRAILGLVWSIDQLDFELQSNRLVSTSGAIYQTGQLRYSAGTTETVDQYGKLQVIDQRTHTWGFIFRAGPTPGDHYEVHLPSGSSQWRWERYDPGYVGLIGNCTGDAPLADNDWIGATIEGTGDATVVRVWRWTDDPDAGNPPNIAANWGVADCTMTQVPSQPVDGGTTLGIRAFTGGSNAPASADSWFGGQCGLGTTQGTCGSGGP